MLLCGCQGVACVATRSHNKEQESYVYSFPESALPPNVSERFSALFEHRTHWTLEELEPYIKCASPPSATAPGLARR